MRYFYTDEEKNFILQLQPHISAISKNYKLDKNSFINYDEIDYINKLIKEGIILKSKPGVKIIQNVPVFNTPKEDTCWLTKKGVKVKKYLENEEMNYNKLMLNRSTISLLFNILTLISAILMPIIIFILSNK